MTNKIQELTVNETWRDEQDAWNHRSEYFVEMHNREDRKAQVTDFLAFLKDENLLPSANCRTPVSYTHLDVYKRQALMVLIAYAVRTISM